MILEIIKKRKINMVAEDVVLAIIVMR